MQIAQFTRVRNVSIAVTILCALIIVLCHAMDTNKNDVSAIIDYMEYSRQCIDDNSLGSYAPESCSLLLRDDSIYKSNPEHVNSVTFSSVDEMEEFADGWDYANTRRVNPYVYAYIKQSLWEYAEWCIDEESDDYWHMKYVASQKTGVYNYSRQIRYKWYKLGYENAPFIVIISLFMLVFVNVLCVLYGLKGTTRISVPVRKMPKWYDNSTDDKDDSSEES